LSFSYQEAREITLFSFRNAAKFRVTDKFRKQSKREEENVYNYMLF